MKTNSKKLIDTNPYLKDRQHYTEVLLRDAIASCRIEGVYCKNLEKRLKSHLTARRKAR